MFGWWKHYHSSLKNHYSSLITYHLKFPKLHPWHVWHYNPIEFSFPKPKYFHLCGTHGLTKFRLSSSPFTYFSLISQTLSLAGLVLFILCSFSNLSNSLSLPGPNQNFIFHSHTTDPNLTSTPTTQKSKPHTHISIQTPHLQHRKEKKKKKNLDLFGERWRESLADSTICVVEMTIPTLEP